MLDAGYRIIQTKIAFLYFFFICFSISCFSQELFSKSTAPRIIVGAERMDQYVALLKGKQVALLINQTSRVGTQHLADTLKRLGVDIKVIFAPEHGFREGG